MLHPVTLLASWFAFALGLQWAGFASLIVLSCACLGAAAVLAARRCRNLLRRARWLLLSLAVLYFLATPGVYVAGFPGELGVTQDGLLRGGEQIARLVALLASLALLHQVTGSAGLLGGLYWLLKPLPSGEATVVRLMLALEYLERERPVDWREWILPGAGGAESHQGVLVLRTPPFRRRDHLTLLAVGMALLAVMLRP
ncbi:MAG: hypothetical protein KGZ43_00030 [Sulfuritalea sp.]|nr:hypothetical protein [Sulfuritalea sp.]